MPTFEKAVTRTVELINAPVVVVTAAAGSAGQRIGYSDPASSFTLINLDPQFGVEYKLGVGPWKYLGKKVGVQLFGSPSDALVRLVNDGAVSVSLDMTVESSPQSVSAWNAPGARMALGGDSLSAFGSYGPGGTSMTVANGIATFVTPNHGIAASTTFVAHLSNPANDAFNRLMQVDRVIDNNTFTAKVPGVPDGTATVSLVFPRSCTVAAWWNWANMFLGAPFDIVVNAGIGGNTTAQLLGRLDTDILAFKPDFCTVLIGTNDIRYGQTQAAVDEAFANIKNICRKLLAAGVTPILCTVLPLEATKQQNFAVVTKLVMALNDQIRAFARSAGNIILADTFQAIVDYAQTDGRARTDCLTDDVHLSGIGAFYVGRAVADAVRAFAPVKRSLIASNGDARPVNASSLNRLANPLMTASGGVADAGVTGGSAGIAADWRATVTGSATAVVSLVDRTVANDGDNIGKNQRFAITSGANGDTAALRIPTPITTFAAGEEVYAEFTMKVSNAVAVQYLLADLVVTVGGAAQHCYINGGSGPNAFPNAEGGYTLTVRTREFLVPANPTGTVLRFDAAFTGAGSLTLEVGRVRIASKSQAA